MKSNSFNGFDLLASVYDPLAWLVYGRSIRDAQTCFLNRIPSQAKVLILGGGTGWLLTELHRVKTDCEVWYIESSAKMLAMARQHNSRSNIHFIHGTIKEMPHAGFDVVITYFFLDLFSAPTLRKMIPFIFSASKPSVLWLVTDFVDRGKWWQQALLKVMYLFFRLICRIEAERLPAWDKTILQSGLKRIGTNHFYGGFIESAAYCNTIS